MLGRLLRQCVSNRSHKEVAQLGVLVKTSLAASWGPGTRPGPPRRPGPDVAELGPHQDADVDHGAFHRQLDNMLVLFVFSGHRHHTLYQDEGIVVGIGTVIGYFAGFENLFRAWRRGKLGYLRI